MSKYLSTAPSQEELWEKVEKLGFVYIKTDDNFIAKDNLSSYNRILTSLYRIWLTQKDYGKTWAFSKEELL